MRIALILDKTQADKRELYYKVFFLGEDLENE